MAQPKHTPAPWHVGVNTSQIESPIGEEFLGVGNESGRTICRVTRLLTEDEEDEYNASLIAAAPDLLSALKTALEHSGCDGDLCLFAWHEIARQAIAKAESE